MEWNEIVAANVRRLRAGKQLTQEQLALDAQLDLTYIGGIERGRRNPTVKVLGQIAAALDVAPADLLRPIN
ncbi:helix-turn-helix domain-containing protein [Novosphingobium sp. TH158]|uniref:helix-turn-helix domain-containing protein n=1 Tax=Novosphingobium sp. TH158 TaxID=2067455 RepID=UPI000C799863|nr:helix-turn-helix transcriptional regulator [Novosphingobium sp. TH158]PLK25450.1 transcriptional regulator [Novosphingobium sp. TH158]